MLHITNWCDAFITFESLANKVVCGVGNKTAHEIGKGIIESISYINEQKFIIHLEDVLYIPTTKCYDFSSFLLFTLCSYCSFYYCFPLLASSLLLTPFYDTCLIPSTKQMKAL